MTDFALFLGVSVLVLMAVGMVEQLKQSNGIDRSKKGTKATLKKYRRERERERIREIP